MYTNNTIYGHFILGRHPWRRITENISVLKGEKKEKTENNASSYTTAKTIPRSSENIKKFKKVSCYIGAFLQTNREEIFVFEYSIFKIETDSRPKNCSVITLGIYFFPLFVSFLYVFPQIQKQTPQRIKVARIT